MLTELDQKRVDLANFMQDEDSEDKAERMIIYADVLKTSSGPLPPDETGICRPHPPLKKSKKAAKSSPLKESQLAPE